MHDAPSVTWPVGRSRWAAGILIALWGCGVAAAAAWSAQPLSGWRLASAWGAVAVTGALAAWNWLAEPAGTLSWDGTSWTWAAAGRGDATGKLQLSLDLQHALLVRWHDGGGRRWFWLERPQAPERWDDLRRAVYSRARPEALPAAEPPAAKP